MAVEHCYLESPVLIVLLSFSQAEEEQSLQDAKFAVAGLVSIFKVRSDLVWRLLCSLLIGSSS